MDILPPDSSAVEHFHQLSDGTKLSETTDEKLRKTFAEKKLEDVVNANCHSLQIVDTFNVPMKVTTDLERSGLWLQNAFTNHGCYPNVHRVIADEWILVRASRDLYVGDELVDSYCEVLRPMNRPITK